MSDDDGEVDDADDVGRILDNDDILSILIFGIFKSDKKEPLKMSSV